MWLAGEVATATGTRRDGTDAYQFSRGIDGRHRRRGEPEFYVVAVRGWNDAITATASTSMSRSSRTSRRTSTAVLAGGCWG
jgi:hypothetical protein